ncbi:MAG TPA: iron ABC transporter permease [Chloroflexota bacterium]|nr:iron ABC transporter permease [Chloroflexota bacterium]
MSRRSLPVLACFAIMAALVGVPVAEVLINSFNTADIGRPPVYGLGNWAAALVRPVLWSAIGNTLALGLVRTAIAIPIALLLAWLIARTDMPGRGLFELLCWIGIFLPVLPLVFAWILMLDPRTGVVNGLAKQFFGVAPFNIYSFWGITWVHLASYALFYPVVLLLPFFRRMAPALEESARMSGASYLQTLFRVTAPILAPAVLGITILSFVRSLESFEVELVLGLPAKLYVYSTLIYDLSREQPPLYGQATVLGMMFLLLLLGLGLLLQAYMRGRDFATVTGRGFSTQRTSLGPWRWVASACCFLYVTICTVLPLALLVVGSFMRRYGFFNLPSPYTGAHWQELFSDPAFGASVVNTVIIALASAAIVVLLYSVVAIATARSKLMLARLTDLLAWLPWAIPGILLSLATLWLILATPLKALLFGSLGGIVLAMVIKSSPLSMQLFRAAVLQIANELPESGRMAGASWGTVYRRILLPLIAPAAVTVGVLTALSASRDIATPALLYSDSTRPAAILMLEYGLSQEFERAAALGVLLVLFATVVTLTARRLGLNLGG